MIFDRHEAVCLVLSCYVERTMDSFVSRESHLHPEICAVFKTGTHFGNVQASPRCK